MSLINSVITSDNLELLHQIEDNYINVIYCDILFGVGVKYDEYTDLKLDYKSFTEFYFERFKEFKRVLKEDGSLFIHTSKMTSHWVRILLDEIFGIELFQHEIIWSFNSAPRKKNHLGSRHESILHYTKSKDYYFDENSVREKYSDTAPKTYAKAKYYNPLGKVMGDVWNINMLAQNDKKERNGYPSQKPLELLNRIILMSSKKNDLVADFFCGSGTTLVSAYQNDRNYLGCDINKNAVELTKQRLLKIERRKICHQMT